MRRQLLKWASAGAGAVLASSGPPGLATKVLADPGYGGGSRHGWNWRTARRLHEAMQGFVSRGEIECLTLAVSRGGRPYVDAVGSLEIGGSERARRDTIYRISSMTKPITAAATLTLVNDGKLTLDEPVDRLLPELSQRRVLTRADAPLDDTVPAQRAITVRDLLTFTWGFGLSLDLLTAPTPVWQAALDLKVVTSGVPLPQEPPPPDEWIRRLGTLPLMHQPGETWRYNTGFEVLGVLVARASGSTFEEYLRERLLEPLGMRDTFFSVPADKLHRLTASYQADPQTGEVGLIDPAVGGQWSTPPAFASGADGLCSTVDDLVAFSQLLLNGGEYSGRRLLSSDLVAQMTSDQLTPQQKVDASLTPGYFDTHGWGFGVAVTTSDADPSQPLGTYGWFGGMGTWWSATPSQSQTNVLLSNRALASPEAPPVVLEFLALAQEL
jgi:CubicO group peptidase (beta-lactamase class C family)